MKNLIQYRKLFSVQLLHEYYFSTDSSLFQGLTDEQRKRTLDRLWNNYRASEFFEISPTIECKNILDRLHLKFKQDSAGFFVACKVNDVGKNEFVPFIPLDETFCLNFTISLKDTRVLTLSNIRLENEIEKRDRFIYYFSNRAVNFVRSYVDNVVDSEKLYLSKPVPLFDSNYHYKAGEIILDDANPSKPVMKEAIEDNGPWSFNDSQWTPIFIGIDPIPQVVTTKDRIVLRPKTFKYKVTDAAQEKLTFVIYNYDGVFLKSLDFETSESGKVLDECNLNFSDLPSGYYILEVQDPSGSLIPALGLRFYMDDALSILSPFALIECLHLPDGSLNEYRWLDQENSNRLLSPKYTIHLRNRSSFWRYYYDSEPRFTSSQVEVYKPVNGNQIKKILVSRKPLGITQFYQRLEINLGGDIVMLPNPEFNSIFSESGRIYSEINMGGGLGPPDKE